MTLAPRSDQNSFPTLDLGRKNYIESRNSSQMTAGMVSVEA
jgi:hypothetical protein